MKHFVKESERSSKDQDQDQRLAQEILELRQENERQQENIHTLETYATFVKEQLVKCETRNQELLKNNEELLNRRVFILISTLFVKLCVFSVNVE